MYERIYQINDRKRKKIVLNDKRIKKYNKSLGYDDYIIKYED